MPRTRPPYPVEFRQHIIELARAGRTPAELAREFGCAAQTIANWVGAAGLDVRRTTPAAESLNSGDREELSRLRRENRQLKVERDILSNSSRDAPRPLAKKHPAPKLVRRPDPRPLAFGRLSSD